MKNVTPDQQTMLATWQQHAYAEFVLKDADAALATMTENPYVLLIGSGVVRVGRAALREFYADKFLPNIPPDFEITTLSQTFGDDRLVEEMAVRFTHTVDHWCPVKRRAELLKAAAGVGLGSDNGWYRFERDGPSCTTFPGRHSRRGRCIRARPCSPS
jgi:hypothetical protein